MAMTFGVSTHLFHEERLDRRHLDAVAAHGFDTIEIFMTATHVDYHDAAAVGALGRWMADTGLRAWSVHAPICDGIRAGVWGRAYSTASREPSARDEAVRETLVSIRAARDLGASVVVLHVGVPVLSPPAPEANDTGAARRSLETIAAACTNAGLRLAVEVIPNALATPSAVRGWLESDLALDHAGACLDVGHANMAGGAPEGIEELSEHVITTHVHDNRGRTDDHLVPFDGTVDWTATLLALAKIGYTGPLVFELPAHGDAARTLARAVEARRRIQAILDEIAAPFPFKDDV
jgi:sugar phosphate isomerase/epimerase